MCLYLAHVSKQGDASRVQLASGDNIRGPVLVDETAVIGKGGEIGPNVVIGANVRIEDGVRIQNATILSDTVVHTHAFVHSSVIGRKCVVGKQRLVLGRVWTLRKKSAARPAMKQKKKSATRRFTIVPFYRSLGAN